MILKGFVRLILVVLVLQLPGPARSDETTSRRALDSLIQLALTANPSLAAMEHRISTAEHRSRYAGGLPDPQMSLGLMDLPRGSFRLGETSMSGVVIGLSQEIPWPGRSSLESRRAKLTVERDRSDAEAMRLELTRMVVTAYSDYSYWTVRKDIVLKTQALMRDMKVAAETGYAHGRGSAQEILRAGAEIDMLENELVESDQMRQSMMFELARLTGGTGAIDSLPPYLPDPSAVDTLQPVDTIDTNPIALKAARQTELATAELKMARTEYWPDLMVGVDYRIRKNMEMDPDRGKDFMSFMVGFKVPLWFFRNQRHQTAAAREELLMAQAEERSVRDFLTQRRRDADLAARTLAQRVKRYDESIIPQAVAARDAARASYEVGATEFEVVLDAQRALLEAETSRLRLVRDYNLQRALLDELSPTRRER